MKSVSLDAVAADEAPLLSNLLELYIHDLSAVFPEVQLGPDGRFGYPELPRYWSEPDRRFAFLIRAQGSVAGFVLASRGSPALPDPDVLDVSEFFVLRAYRRSGVGRLAAQSLWQRLPGKWTVRVSEANQHALAFWSEVVGEFTHGAVSVVERPGRSSPWRVFVFESTPFPQNQNTGRLAP